jgi:hypothetical protein
MHTHVIRQKAFFGIFWSSAMTFLLMSYVVVKCVLEAHFRAGNSQKSLRARSGECGGWVMTGIATQQMACGSVRYLNAETTVPATFPELHCTTSAELTHRNDQ